MLLKLRPEAFCVRRVDVQPTVHYLRVLCDGSRRLQRNFKTQDLVNTSKQKPADSLSWSSVAEIASRLPKSFVRRDALVSTAVRCVLFSLYLSLSDPFQ